MSNTNQKRDITLFRSITMLCGNDSGECFEFGEYPGIFYGILSVPHNTLMDLNNVMDH